MTTEEQERSTWRRWLDKRRDGIVDGVEVIVVVFFLGILGLSLLVMFLESVEQCIAELVGVSKPKDVTAKYAILKVLGICEGGVLLSWQALSSRKRAKAMEDAASAQAEATKEQARTIGVTEAGQRQERLKNAIEHLGNESVSVRLGGAYELFHLAEDNEALRKTALDILCAHIRGTTGESEYKKTYSKKPSEEVQSLLTLLFVEKHQVFNGLRADLKGSFLNGANLWGARLYRVDLGMAELQGAWFGEARLQGARFEGAHLQGAKFERAHLQGARFEGAHLQGAWFEGTHLQGAWFEGTHLQGARFGGARLQGARFEGTHLQGARFEGAHLRGARFVGVHLQGARFVGTHLQGARFEGARLQGARFEGAHLQGARFEGAHLQGAFLYDADLRGAEGGNWRSQPVFAQRMNERIGKESDLSNVVFEGGLRQEEVDDFVKDLSKKEADRLRLILEPHVGLPGPRGLPENHGAIIGAYTKEEAEQWIADYEEAMSEVPKDDNP